MSIQFEAFGIYNVLIWFNHSINVYSYDFAYSITCFNCL